MSKLYYSIIFVCALLALSGPRASAQEGHPVADSALANVRLPAGALRVEERSVPGEIRDTLGKLIALGGGKTRQGGSEVLVWAGGFRQSNRGQFARKLTEGLQAGGWTYAVGEENPEFTVFNSVNTAERRAVIGFWTAKDDSLVLAWTEMLPAGAAPNAGANRNGDRPASGTAAPTGNNDRSARVVTAEKNALWVNVMGDEAPPLPKFPTLAPKPGKVRGYVKDWTGKPLAGAAIGVRSSYFAGHYSGAQGTTDAKGYYEIAVPKGSAHFYNAGYQIEWGGGVAAVSLHPADGSLDSFTTMDGAVENFVFLPYGVTSRENLQNNPRVPSTYYGGSIYVHYYAAEAGDSGAMKGSIREGSILEITLTSEDPTGGSFVIRQPVGFAGNVTINNIPLGRYKISAKAGGRTLRLKENSKLKPTFGLTPGDTVGAASVLFVPSEARASMIGPANGAWDRVDLSVLAP